MAPSPMMRLSANSVAHKPCNIHQQGAQRPLKAGKESGPTGGDRLPGVKEWPLPGFLLWFSYQSARSPPSPL